MASTKDLSAKSLVFNDGHTDDGKPRFAAFVHGYTPRDTLHARAEADRAPYDVWVREGHLTATPGPVIRNDFVAKDLVDDRQRFDLVAVAYDRYLIKDFETALGELGAELPLLEHGQGFAQRKGCAPDCDKRHEHVPAPLWMPQSITELETLILERRIRVNDQPRAPLSCGQRPVLHQLLRVAPLREAVPRRPDRHVRGPHHGCRCRGCQHRPRYGARQP